MQIVRVESRAAAVRCGPFFCPGRPGTGKNPYNCSYTGYWRCSPVRLQLVKKKYQIVLFLVDRCAVIAYCIYTR